MSAATQPTGEVTLVFTDIEGSTRLLERLGPDDYREALDAHRRAVRAAFAGQDGYEVSYEGDSFFYAFPTSGGAVRAAEDACRALEPGEIRIRVGIHTGTPGLDPPKYVGLDVHRAARIMSGAHGGQIVMSGATAERLDSAFPLTDLGLHHFKDISAPEHVYQLGAEEHPPLRSLYRTTLPVPPTSFLGRAGELDAVCERLTDAATRLLTLTGMGGTGKSRLALEAATRARSHFPDGTTWVPLAPLRDAALVLPEIARALGARDEHGAAPRDVVVAALEGKQALLVLDNAEHLLPGVAEDVAELLRRCPTVRALVTSRERLRITAETAWPVPTLEPDDAEELLVERARAAGIELERDEHVAALCRRLDDLPLAVELAAARLTLFTPAELHARLGEQIDLLAGNRDADARQRTLQATLDWSFDLLGPGEQRAYGALSVFAGGATLAAVEAVSQANPEILQSLVEKHLVRRRVDGPDARYAMLETVRRHAAGKLTEPEACDAVGRAIAFERETISSFANKAVYSTSDDWAPSFWAEEANVLGLLGHAEPHALADEGLALAVLASQSWYELGRIRTAAGALEGLVESPAIRDELGRAYGLRALARVDVKRGEWDNAIRRCSEALLIHQTLGDRRGECIASGTLGAIYGEKGDTESARGYLENGLAIAEELGDDGEIGRASYNLGMLISDVDGSYERALPLFEKGYEAQSRVGHTPGMLMGLHVIGEARCEAGDLAGGLDALTSCLELALATHHDVYVPELLEGLGQAAAAIGRWPEAATFTASADELRARSGLVGSAKNADSQRSLREMIASNTSAARPLDASACLALGRALASDARVGATPGSSFVR